MIGELKEGAWVLPLSFALFGACIGSFLNVVIYRLPRGLNINEPRRSFCPSCKTPIPWYHNLPIISWLALRGKSACCHQGISIRYWLVEIATALLFAAIGYYFSYDGLLTQTLLCIWAATMVAILCIDWEHMIVLPSLAGIAAGAGLLAALTAPWLVAAEVIEPEEGLQWSLAGGALGFGLLKLVALLGRICFGHKVKNYTTVRPWSLQQTGDDLTLSIGDEQYLWSELFLESSNRLQLLSGTLSSFADKKPGNLCFTVDGLTLADGTHLALENCESLSGTCMGLSTQREAMGSGDAWIALAIGTICGWEGVVFALVVGSLIGLVWAALARIGRGQPMPFGPSFIAGAYLWLFFGTPILIWYTNLLSQ